MINKKWVNIVFVLGIALFFAGCGTQTVETGSADVNVDTVDVEVTVGDNGVDVSVGNDEEVEEESAQEDEAEIVTVAMRDYKFDEQEITIKEGTTVIWTNYDSAPHTVDGEGLDSGTISKGESWTYTFTTKGLYDYYCSYHPSMTGTVVVE